MCSPPFICALSCSPRRAGHCGSFIFVWRGRERDSGEVRGAHLVGGNGTAVVGLGLGERPRLLSSRAARSVSNGPDRIPLRGYLTCPPWTMGTVHERSVGRSTRTVVDRANPRTPRGPLSASDGVSRGPLGILHFNPPVSSKSTRGPT